MKEPNFNLSECGTEVLMHPENEANEQYAEAVKRVDFLLDKASVMLSGMDFSDSSLARKIKIWKIISAVGQARVIVEGEFNKRLMRESPRIVNLYDEIIKRAAEIAASLPENDPAAVVSNWRLEKPLIPFLPKLTPEEEMEANTPCGKFVYENPAEFEQLLREKSPEHAETFKIMVEFATEVKDAGGRVLLVGGGVRDMRTNVIPKDFDIEIYGLSEEEIVNIAKRYGQVNEVGSSFSVRKVKLENGMDIDLAMPRIDSQATPDHRDVKTLADSNMPVCEACRRRDFTINSMAADILTGDLFDFFGGDDDLKNGILRVTDERLFCDDPLRVLRGLQFIGRQGLIVDSRTEEIMRLMVFELENIAKDRFREEWSKLLLKSKIPSLGLIKAAEIGVFKELYPDFYKLIQIKQDPEWHPEGSVWIHTLLSVDKAAQIIAREGVTGDDAFAVMMAVLGHDLGKAKTTQELADGKIVSPGHEVAGVEPMLAFMEQNGIPSKMAKRVAVLVANHMAPVLLYEEETLRGNNQKNAVRRLAAKLAVAGATIQDLLMVSEADQAGRFDNESPGTLMRTPFVEVFPAGGWLLDKFNEIKIVDGKPAEALDREAVLKLVEVFGGGAHIAQIKELANRLHDEKGWDTKQILDEIMELTANTKDGRPDISGAMSFNNSNVIVR